MRKRERGSDSEHSVLVVPCVQYSFILLQIPSLNPLVVEKHFSNKQALNVVLRNKGPSIRDTVNV